MYLEGGTFSGSPRASFCVSAYMWGWTFRPRLWYNYKKAARSKTRARRQYDLRPPALKARLTRRLVQKRAPRRTTPARRRRIWRISARWTTRPMPPCSCAITAHRATGPRASARRALPPRRAARAVGRGAGNSPDAQETLARVIASKTRGKPLNEKDYKRLPDALLRRGFSWGEVKTALRTAGAALTDADDGL